jgi:hypothetical protein
MRKRVHVKKIRCILRQKKPQLHTLKQLAEKIDAQIRTSTSKNAFQLINRLSIVHPARHDGGIMTCFLSDDKNDIVTGQETVLKSCLQQLQTISGAAPVALPTQQNFPTLLPLTQE